MLYAQCFIDGIKYLLLEAFFDHKKNDLTHSTEDQKVIIKGSQTFKKPELVGTFASSRRTALSCEMLSNFKKLHPIQVTKYAIT